jgi:hypothetical protein
VTASETNIKSLMKLAPGWTIEIVGTERETTKLLSGSDADIKMAQAYKLRSN